MMALILIAFILLCAWWFLRAANRLFGFIKPKPKKSTLPVIKYIKAEEVKPDPIPTVTNIQNNYNTTQIVIIEASKN